LYVNTYKQKFNKAVQIIQGRGKRIVATKIYCTN
jgi:hypothetical protein